VPLADVEMKRLSENQILQYILLAGLMLMGCYLFSTFPLVPLNIDAGLYIPIAREVMQGGTPTVDLYTSYTPFAYYLYAAWMGIAGTDVSMLVLLVYLVNALNAMLFYFIVRKYVASVMLGIALALSYFLTVMICQGYMILLEPFQTTFILLAFMVYTSGPGTLLRYVLVGLFLGVSIMFKQYSVLVLAGFVLTVIIDTLQREGQAVFREAGVAVAAILVSSAIPFFLFILLSQAELMNALYQFGFLGNKAMSYSTAEKLDTVTRARNIAVKVIHLNWMFVPVLIYLLLRVFRSRDLRVPCEVTPIFVFSALPIAIRQYGHYFLLIAPWSYLIAGALLDRLVQEPFIRGKSGSLLYRTILLCSLALALCAYLTPSFHELAKARVTLFTGILIMSASLMLAAWLSLCRLHKDIMGYVLAVLIVLGVESTFLAMKIPFNEMRETKQQQALEAQRISRFVARGSDVLVVDYPELYVLCDYTNPFHNYSFIYPRNITKKLGEMSLHEVDRAIASRYTSSLASPFFERSGLKMIHYDTEARLYFFSRTGNY